MVDNSYKLKMQSLSSLSMGKFMLLNPLNRQLCRKNNALMQLALKSFYYPDGNHHHLNQEVLPFLFNPLASRPRQENHPVLW